MIGWNVSVVARPGWTGAVLRAESLDDAFSKGEEYAAVLFSNDETRRVAEIEVSHSCEACKGTGRVLKKRTKTILLKCLPCNGYGWIIVAEARRAAQ